MPEKFWKLPLPDTNRFLLSALLLCLFTADVNATAAALSKNTLRVISCIGPRFVRPSPEQLRSWTRQIRSDQYPVRKKAIANLIRSGRAGYPMASITVPAWNGLALDFPVACVTRQITPRGSRFCAVLFRWLCQPGRWFMRPARTNLDEWRCKFHRLH